MVRNVLGSVLAVAGAAAAVWSPFRAWYDGRHGRHYRLADLFSGGGVTDVPAELFASLFLPFAVAALITLVGLLLRSRLLVGLAGVIVLGFTVVWTVRVGQAESGLTVSGDADIGLGTGAGLAFAGGVLLLMAAVILQGRGRHGRHAARVTAPDQTGPPVPAPDGRPPYDPGPTTPAEDAPTATWPQPPEDHGWRRPPPDQG